MKKRLKTKFEFYINAKIYNKFIFILFTYDRDDYDKNQKTFYVTIHLDIYFIFKVLLNYQFHITMLLLQVNLFMYESRHKIKLKNPVIFRFAFVQGMSIEIISSV